MAEYQNPIDALFDEDNCDVITLSGENGKKIDFEQIALIPLEDKVYAILKPLQPMEGVGEDEGLVFSIETTEEGQEILMLTTDEGIIDAVFAVYDQLVAEDNED